MQASNLKASLITAYCFVIALCSEIKSMDAASDFQETKSYKAKNTNNEGYLDSLKTDVCNDSSIERFLLNQDENKLSETSWATYISYPFKAAINGTYNIAEFAIKHPTQTIITSLVIAAQFTAVAAEVCNCIYIGDGGYPYSLGMFPNEMACKTAVKNTLGRFRGCF